MTNLTGGAGRTQHPQWPGDRRHQWVPDKGHPALWSFSVPTSALLGRQTTLVWSSGLCLEREVRSAAVLSAVGRTMIPSLQMPMSQFWNHDYVRLRDQEEVKSAACSRDG